MGRNKFEKKHSSDLLSVKAVFEPGHSKRYYQNYCYVVKAMGVLKGMDRNTDIISSDKHFAPTILTELGRFKYPELIENFSNQLLDAMENDKKEGRHLTRREYVELLKVCRLDIFRKSFPK